MHMSLAKHYIPYTQMLETTCLHVHGCMSFVLVYLFKLLRLYPH